MNREEFTKSYWQYYLLLENKFLQTINYVEPSENNFSAYSVEFAYLLQSIGGELDTFFKFYCDFQLDDRRNISDYKRCIIEKYPDVLNQKVALTKYELVLTPFADWDSLSPEWWTSYNKVKHNRYNNLEYASLKNVLNILAALFLLEMKYFKENSEAHDEFDRPDEESLLFQLVDWQFTSIPAKYAFLIFMEQMLSESAGTIKVSDDK